MASITELDEQQCLALARSKSVGRIGLQIESGLRIFPVSYTVHGDAIVFRTLPYGAIAQVAYGAEVAFEIDELDERGQTGWSVLVVGRCRRIEDADEVEAVRAGGDPQPWVEGTRSLYFRVDANQITGRQIGEASRPAGVPRSRTAPEQEQTAASVAAEAARDA